MRYEKIFTILSEYFDKKQCYEHVQNIYTNDRWFDFAHFQKTAHYCKEQMEKIGLQEIGMIPLKADGKTAYGDWVIPRAWDVSGAELKIMDYDHTVIANYNEVPCSLMMYSASTLAGGVTAEVIMADNNETVTADEVKGKFIFTGNRPGTVLPLAINGGAIGIISDYFPMFPGARDDRRDVYDACRWENGFISPLNNTGLFGFSLSPRYGDLLREKIAEAARKGECIKLHAEVDTRFYDGIVHTVSGLIPGTHCDKEEVILCGHLYEPGANDNASGCGLILELASAIMKGIEEGSLPVPSRGIRIIMGFEAMGIMGYCEEYPERTGRTIGAINMDMVGSDTRDRARMHLWHNPMSNWSYMDTLISSLNNEYRRIMKDESEFTDSKFGIGDNLISDPMINIPAVSMVMHPAKSYHSSIDTMDLINTGVLRRNALICGAFLFFLACPEKEEVLWLLEEIKAHAIEMINIEMINIEMINKEEERMKSHTGLFYEKEGNEQDKAFIYMLGEVFYKGCLSLKSLLKGIGQEVDKKAGMLPRMKAPHLLINDNSLEHKFKTLIPVRKIRGCISFHTLDEKIRKSIQWKPIYNYNLNCPLFWTDGKRNLMEIVELSAVELGKRDLNKYVNEMLDYYEFLEKYEYIYFKEGQSQ